MERMDKSMNDEKETIPADLLARLDALPEMWRKWALETLRVAIEQAEKANQP